MLSPSKGRPAMNAVERRRRSGSRPPWMMPKSAWSVAAVGRQRPLGPAVRPLGGDRPRRAGSVDAGGTGWSKATATSAPSASWIAIDDAPGVKRCDDPSWWLRNVTPSSSIALQVAERDDLEAARVGEDRPVPAHEAVEAAEPRDPLVARTQVEVVGVGQDDRRAGVLEVVGVEGLDGGVRADRHEGRRLHDPVGQLQAPEARAGRAVGGRRDEDLEAGGARHGRAQASGAAGRPPARRRAVRRRSAAIREEPPRGTARARRAAAAPRSPAPRGGRGPGPSRPAPAASGRGTRSAGGTARRRPRPSRPPRRGRPPSAATPTGPPPNFWMIAARSRRSVASRPSASISRTPIASSHGRQADAAVAVDLGVVAHAPQEPVDDARRGPPAPGDRHGGLVGDLDPEDPRRAPDDGHEVLVGVEVEAVDGPEAIAQRAADPPGARRGPDDREGPQGQAERARRGPLADHHVEGVVLHRRVEDLLDRPVEAVDLVDEEDVALVERGQDGGQVPGPLDRGAGRVADVDPELAGDDGGERRLAEAGRAVQEDVVRGLPPLARRRQQHREAGLHLALAEVLVQAARPERALDGDLRLVDEVGREESGGVGHRRESSTRRAPFRTDVRTPAGSLTTHSARSGGAPGDRPERRLDAVLEGRAGRRRAPPRAAASRASASV